MENIVFVIAVTIIGSSWSESPNVDPSAEHRDRALANETEEEKNQENRIEKENIG